MAQNGPTGLLGGGTTRLPGIGPGGLSTQTSAQPWREVPLLNGSGDEKRALFFVSLTCPYCAQYHEALWGWSQSLPPGWSAQFEPVLVQGIDSGIELKALRAAQKADSSKVGDFLRSAYYALQQQAMPSNSEATWQSVVSASGYDTAAYSAAWQSLSDDVALIDPVVKRQTHYGIEVTPTVVVGGKYVVTPDSTNGNEGLFMQLLNGVVSKALGVA